MDSRSERSVVTAPRTDRQSIARSSTVTPNGRQAQLKRARSSKQHSADHTPVEEEFRAGEGEEVEEGEKC